MATTGADAPISLAVVRRLEAAGFRAWPATSTFFDGTWAVRLTTSFPAKRLNSVNPLDRSDDNRLDERIEAARLRFAEVGRPLLFRQSPLCSPRLAAYLDEAGWSRFGESVVYMADLATIDLDPGVDRIPIHDGQRYLEASLIVHERPASLRPGLEEVLNSIRPPAAFFIREDEAGVPLAVALAITDNDLAGILDVAVVPAARRRGMARDLVTTALRHTMHRGARTGWLQVEADNEAGLSLYRKLGFREAYRYVYRAPPGVAV
ncbi:GCN5 family acetyltransferase [Aureimonas ureilytica]|uniref:GCN5 family acetyltransferase n=1 Tax=Aureimonas ureilytica TaxID=401562 RepID=A0A175R861_9HYPH|nr:GCN5 family acetyltransferase [Aureimonas ureilytica]